MAINVYWCSLVGDTINDSLASDLYHSPPEPLIKNMPEWYTTSGISRCPASTDVIKNAYVLKFHHDYKFNWSDNKVTTDVLDQRFFNSSLNLTEYNNKLIQIRNYYWFFSDKPLKMLQTHPYWHNNNFTKNATVLSGEYDIGQWFRPLTTACILNNDEGTIEYSRNDVSSYVRFLTKEKIKLNRFEMTESLHRITQRCVTLKNSKYHAHPTPLLELYKLFNNRNSKKNILKKIKENLI